jgi:hypothetical protein
MATVNWTEVSALALAATAGVAVLALLGAVAQLIQNHRHERTRLAHRYLERYGSPDEIPLVAKFFEFVKVEPAARGMRLAEWEKTMSVKQRLEILHGLNFWEELAGMYLRGLIDRKVVRQYFGDSALTYWDWSEWFIDHQRRLSPGIELMNQFEAMCDHIQGGRTAATRRMTFPYSRRWRGARRADRLVQQYRGVAGLYDWQRRLAIAAPPEQERMLAELCSGLNSP